MEVVKKFIDEADEDTIQAVEEYIRKKKFPREPVVLKIPYKFPSLNEYIDACRESPFAGAAMKKRIQKNIGYFINTLPIFERPIVIDFTWVEGNSRRDPDNVTYAKKFVLDTMVVCGKIADDKRNYVPLTTDKLKVNNQNEWGLILEIREVEE